MASPSKRRFNFTTARLSRLKPPETGRAIYYDTSTPNLSVVVTAKGVKSFYVYRRVQGKPTRLQLGQFPKMNVSEARAKASAIQAQIESGGDPRRGRRNQRGQICFDELFQHFLEAHAKPHKKTWQEDQRQYNQYLKPLWEGRGLDRIEQADIRALHTKVGKKHPYAANRLLALIRTIFNKAHELGWSGDNPTKGIKKFRERSRDRFLQPDELASFWKALRDEPNELMRDFFAMLLLTGARRDNVQSMMWEDVSLKRCEWRIPDTKSGEAVTVPLTSAAMEILRRRREQNRKTKWVFPSRKATRTGHITEPKGAWKRLRERAGLKDIRMHDLRRTQGSWQAATGASLPVIGKALGHKRQETTQIYARLNIDPVREAMQKAENAMMENVNGKDSAE